MITFVNLISHISLSIDQYIPYLNSSSASPITITGIKINTLTYSTTLRQKERIIPGNRIIQSQGRTMPTHNSK